MRCADVTTGFDARTRETADRLARAAGAVLRNLDGMPADGCTNTEKAIAEERLRSSVLMLRMAVTHYLRTT